MGGESKRLAANASAFSPKIYAVIQVQWTPREPCGARLTRSPFTAQFNGMRWASAFAFVDGIPKLAAHN